jgi:multiple sugar transport system permease protein
VVLQFIVGLGTAIMLNQKVKGISIFRAIILVLPWATPDIVTAVAWKWIYNDMYGVLNDMLMRVGIIHQSVTWLGNKDLALYMVIIANTWKGFSISAMFYLAGLQGVSTEILEAARVDGANNFAVFWNVLIPYLLPTIGTTVVLTVIFTINYFPLIYIMTGGGPAQATETFVTWAYTLGFKFLHFPKSAVVSTITFLVILVFAAIYASRFVKNMEVESD